jgi:glyoxylase-like metal-dependent hydrolase (beta-lactamase superfamily II)
MSDYQIKVIKTGYAKWLSPTELHADGTITLITGSENIIVDTGGPWDREIILTALSAEQIDPESVSFVVCTHGHSDHTGNNNLFLNATLIFGHDISRGDLYIIHDFDSEPYKIDDNIEIVATPGHTKQDVSVIVRTNDGIVAIVGDLFESAHDERIWRKFSESPEEQEASRKQILELADFIIPGHGGIFSSRA